MHHKVSQYWVCCCCWVTQSCPTLFETPWTAAHQASLSFTNSQSLLKLMSTESVMLSNHLILCCSLRLLPSIFPSIAVFSNDSLLPTRWHIGPSNEYSGLISFKIDRLEFLAVQGTLKRLLQHHSLEALILWCSAFFMVQLTSVHTYWKNHSFGYMDLCWQSDIFAF